MKIVALAGGVGGAKFAHGLAQHLSPENLTVIVNTGDDFDHFGLHVSPDIDTVCYTLAGLANNETGWGRAGETWQALENAVRLGGPDWFRLGDQDLGTHLERTRRLQAGEPLSAITRHFCEVWGIRSTVLPMSDDPVRTMVRVKPDRVLPFQEYFVREQCRPVVTGFHFSGSAEARPAPGTINAIQEADLVVLCPSNPWVSIDPILSIPGIREAIERKPVFGVSPLIGGRAVKGPAAKMFSELGIQPTAKAVAEHYRDLLTGFVLDNTDRSEVTEIAQWGIISLATDILMRDINDRKRLAIEVLSFAERSLGGNP